MDPNLVLAPRGDRSTASVRNPWTRRIIGSPAAMGVLAVLTVMGALALTTSTASAQARDAEEEEGGIRVERIEISFYGGYIGGDTYLELPPLATDLTNDTALDEILDFRGQIPEPPVEAPTKKIEAGWRAGGNATFYLSPNFGLTLFGEYGSQEAVFTGQRVIDGQRQDERVEIDRSSMTTVAGGGSIVYHIGRERKHPIRPFVQLGFGGILNQFPDTDDIGALFFTFGMGLGFPIADSWRGFVVFDSRLYTWETDEVALDSTLLFPGVSVGLTWRHVVPEEVADDTGGGE